MIGGLCRWFRFMHKMIAVVFGARVVRETGSYAATYQSALNMVL